MWPRTVVLLIVGLSSYSLFGQERMISHVTRTNGGFVTTVQIENRKAIEQIVRLTPYDAQGVALPVQEITIQGGAVRASAIAQLFGEGVEVSHFGVAADEKVAVSVSYDFSGVGSPAQVDSSSARSQSWRVFPGDWTHVFDGLAVVNAGDAASDITITQKDYAGNVLASAALATALAANAKALYIIGSPDGSPFMTATPSYFEISATQPLAVTALRGTLISAPIGLLWANEALPLD